MESGAGGARSLAHPKLCLLSKSPIVVISIKDDNYGLVRLDGSPLKDISGTHLNALEPVSLPVKCIVDKTPGWL